jgi:hypothetical protein
MTLGGSILARAKAEGVRVFVDNDALRYEAARPPSSALLVDLKLYRSEVLEALTALDRGRRMVRKLEQFACGRHSTRPGRC